MTDRIPLDHLTSDQYDTLCERVERAEDAIARVRETCDALADGTEAGFRAALTIREALDQPAPAAADQPREHCGGGLNWSAS